MLILCTILMELYEQANGSFVAVLYFFTHHYSSRKLQEIALLKICYGVVMCVEYKLRNKSSKDDDKKYLFISLLSENMQTFRITTTA